MRSDALFFSPVKFRCLYLHVFIVYLILPVTDSQTDGHSECLEKPCSLIGLFICRFWLSLGKYNKEKSLRSKFRCRCFHKISALVLNFPYGCAFVPIVAHIATVILLLLLITFLSTDTLHIICLVFVWERVSNFFKRREFSTVMQNYCKTHCPIILRYIWSKLEVFALSNHPRFGPEHGWNTTGCQPTNQTILYLSAVSF